MRYKSLPAPSLSLGSKYVESLWLKRWGCYSLGIASTCLTQEQTPKKKVSEQFAFLPAVLVESRESVE